MNADNQPRRDENQPSLAAGLFALFCLGSGFLFILFICGATIWEGLNPKPREATQVKQQPASRSVVNGWNVDIAALPQSRRQRIFYELVAAQDSGVGDVEAYIVIARRHNISTDTVYQIAGEGAAKAWPMP